MRVLHAIAGIPPNAGGPSRSVPGLCRALSDAGVETWLVSFYPGDTLADPRGVRFLKGPGGRYADALRTAQTALDAARPDLVHVHGLWTPANHAVITGARKRGLPVVISVRGMLDPWALAQKRWKKRLAMLLYQRRDLRAAALLHATAPQECDNIRKQGFRQPVAVIPNGVDMPGRMPAKRVRDDGRRVALFLSRLHPGKGLIDLVTAWANARPDGWVMRIAGPDVCGHEAEVQSEIERLGVLGDFEFVGALDDTAKWQAYADADLFVHPSHSENFGISIAEALTAGLPVLTTTGTPWRALVDERCGWWVAPGADSLAKALPEALGTPPEALAQMGARGRDYARRTFSWAAIAAEMMRVYEWCMEGTIVWPKSLKR